ncbi:MAG: MFS transporter [Deltaproteobacteria bacterium]|nr:MFS transporter [Deltaproteobacteria bacterium]
MGPGISGPLVPFVGWLIGAWGWRTAAVISGIALLIVSAPVAFAINRIADAQEAEMDRGSDAKAHVGHSSHGPADPQFTLAEVLRLKSFWYLSTSGALRHMVTEGVSVHFVILLVDRGWSMAAASSLLGLSTIIGAPARIGMGWLGDMVEKRLLIMGLLLALSVSVFFMGWSADPMIFTPFMVIYSLSYGGLASLQEPIRADYFGVKAFATIQGMSRTVTTIGTFMGPVVAGFCYDVTKSYTIAFSIFAAVSLVSTLLMFLAKRPKARDEI